jgi:CheY-like chemotaxis protein
MEKKRILIIDDEVNFTKLIKRNLELGGQYEVRAENSGRLGLAAAKEFKPDLIFLDILMPDMDGTEVGFQLESDTETKGIPVAYLTAIVNKEEVERSKGCIAGRPFIAKPVSAEELIDYIEKKLK